MDAVMFQGLGTHRSEVAANSQIHINSRIDETRLKAVLRIETAADRSHPLTQETATGQ